MEEKRNQPGQQPERMGGQNTDNKNQTVGTPGSKVPDYGRSRQEMEEKSKQEGGKEREIPMGNEETIGNP